MSDRFYLCIDLKSFFASVECAARGLDPMNTRLVVADPSRGKGTICLAVSPAMKASGVRNRCRVYEIPEHLEYITAPPRMQMYIDCSAEIYDIYLKYIAAEDIHVYSIDEAFLDVTDYLSLYRMSARELGIHILSDIQDTLGIPAVCGIGTNLYLAKIALDITAKRTKSRISCLDEESFKKILWHHRPLSDFWRIGKQTEKRLSSMGLMDMYDIAHTDEKLLYRTFGVDAVYLIDHAWGREPVTMKNIKAYQPKEHSISNGQVLLKDYNYESALLITKEMTDILCLDLVDKRLVTNSITLYVGYSFDTVLPSRGTASMRITTSSVRLITDSVVELFHRIVNPDAKIRRIEISCNHIMDEGYEQYDLFTNPRIAEKDYQIQHAVNDIKHRFGKNAIIRGMDLLPDATTIERNMQIGGHKSGDSESDRPCEDIHAI